jgi:lipoyl(octanoyl) transferase
LEKNLDSQYLRNLASQKKMNKIIQLQDLGNKDYKETWEYQVELFKGIVDLKIQNRREETCFFIFL